MRRRLATVPSEMSTITNSKKKKRRRRIKVESFATVLKETSILLSVTF